jgi:probable HAF family extracellular repeat protein
LRVIRWVPAAALAALSLAAATIHAQPMYGIKDLGTLGGSFSGSLSLNADAHIVGYSQIAGSSLVHGFLAGPAGMTDVGTLGGDQSVARAINGLGHMVGWAFTASGERHAFLLRSGEMLDLGTLSGWPIDAWGLNDRDEVVGSYEVGTYERAYVWRDGLMNDLGTLGGTDSRAYAINEHGDIAGFARPFDNTELHACIWRDGVPEDLGTLGGWASHAYDINDYGKVVGWTMEVPNHISHGYVWTNGVMVDLGSLGGPYSAAFAINNQGEVVGASTDDLEQQRAVYCSGGPPWVDLNTRLAPGSGWLLTSASDINESGQIVGAGQYNGQEHAYLLTPLPALVVDPNHPRLEFAGAAPNPSYGRTRLSFTLAIAGHASLRIYDLAGRSVRNLADGRFGAGSTSLDWDGRDDDGQRLGAGLYWARFESAGLRATARIALLH